MDYHLFSDLPRIGAALLSSPWLILPGHHRSMVEQLEAHRSGKPRAAPVVVHGDDWEAEAEPEYGLYDPVTRVGLLEIKGVIGKGLSRLSMACGGVCLDQVENALDGLRAHRPRAVQLYLNTPGGTVTGVEEFRQALQDFAAKVCPVHAFSDVMCCSAGEWIAAGATTHHAAGSSVLGSIGVYHPLIDETLRYAQDGVKVHLVNSGPDKGAGYPGTPITSGHIAKARLEVDAIGADFFGAMAKRWKRLQPAVHFTGETFRAKSLEGRALHDGILPSRRHHLTWMLKQHHWR